jgi:hypothetical protein
MRIVGARLLRWLVNGQLKVPVGGHENCRLVANKNCPVADTNLPMRVMPATGVVVSSRV